MTSHMQPGHNMRCALPHSGASSSPLRTSVTHLPDVCLQPNSAEELLDPYGLPRPRGHGFVPASLHHERMDSSQKENDRAYSRNPSLRVDCHLFSPPTDWNTQPITPSPQSSSTLYDNSSGWMVPKVSLKRNSANETQSEGKRIGYDGTTQTPSVQLLKPTASSLGHRVTKATARAHQVLPLPPNAFGMHSPKIGLKPQDMAPETPVLAGNKVTGALMPRTTLNTPASPHLYPFGQLNKSLNKSNHSTSEEDEDMASMSQCSSHLLEGFDFDVQPTEEDGVNNRHLLKPPRSALQRCASWSPGSRQLQQGSYSSRYGRSCPETLRCHNIDPVASQLLRACTVHEEEEGGQQDRHSFSLSSHAFGQIPADASGRDDAALCRSPMPISNNDNFSFSASMPDLLSPIHPGMNMDEGGRKRGSKRTPMIAEESLVDYPLSPVPFVRDVSNSLLDVEEGDDAKFLARPVARKFCIPAIGGSPTRRSSRPTSHRTLEGHGSL